jgi:toxin CcdB
VPQQFEIFRLPDGTLAVALQDDLHETLKSRIVAPLVPLAGAGPQPKGLSPVFDISEQPHALLVQSMGSIPCHLLQKPVGSLRPWRDDIVRALDILFTGV